MPARPNATQWARRALGALVARRLLYERVHRLCCTLRRNITTPPRREAQWASRHVPLSSTICDSNVSRRSGMVCSPFLAVGRCATWRAARVKLRETTMLSREIGPSGSATASPTSLLAADVRDRFGVLPNFFRLADSTPEITANLWGFARFAYLDNPLPSLFKERLFVYLSRFCEVRYCIARHVGFLIGLGRPSGDAHAVRNRSTMFCGC